MVIYPVLDLKAGTVVHGVAGERQRYRPVRSRLVDSPTPLEVARAYRRHFGFSTLYVADLDALEGQPPALQIYRRLREDGFRLLVDGGVRSWVDARALLDIEGITAIAPLECLPSPADLEAMVRLLGAPGLLFSLDLRAGRPLACSNSWPPDPRGVARIAARSGVQRILLLDLAHVGRRGGPPHLELCKELVAGYPRVSWLTGGGVRGPDDLRSLEAVGIEGVLVATALHDGSLGAEDLRPHV